MNILNYLRKNSSGFTMIELLIVIALGVTLSVVGFSSYQNFKARKDVELSTREVAAAIQNTQLRSVTQEEGKRWGVRLSSVTDGDDKYEVYTGSSYSTSTVVSQTTFRLPVEFSEPAEGRVVDLNFEPITGRLSSDKIISISRENANAGTGNIIVNSLGSVTARMEDDLIGYWQFEEGSGTATYDNSNNGNDGTLTGPPSWVSGSSCRVGSCLDFNGSSDYVSSNISNINDGTFTLSMWIKYDSLPTANSGLAQAQNGGSTPGGTKTIGAWIASDGDVWGRIIQSNGTTQNLPTNDTALTNSDTWYLVTYVADGSNYKLYLNGDYKKQVAYNGTLQEVDIIFIGIQGSEEFDGVIDDVRLYDDALSDEEVEKLYDDLK